MKTKHSVNRDPEELIYKKLKKLINTKEREIRIGIGVEALAKVDVLLALKKALNDEQTFALKLEDMYKSYKKYEYDGGMYLRNKLKRKSK